ncbi:protein transport protein Sec24-like At3g07100 isoform X2 [Abrus precatorius]|uniref:Protein transport protein Sec24-like At3g07100 isoform X2 n=1 Tax=Abrus precatorius TaxID=3816 RepID=A0A8B8M838_ABRPR|nr:protein transport protein Sec24-like At3g07100 isoform X2 [Abrus precatorius]XP_027363228.1 protein transport protein Sec24-like At3g07100 isoform X2 [Abrus precatorius]XP_027363229.1 protein transport protein Sec24-like At3g07100 isoform X2 [Abrus precatorius]
MGTENPGRPTFASRPPYAAGQTNTPFPPAGAMVGSEPPSFRPTPPAPPLASTPFPSPGPVGGPGVPSFRLMPPGQFNDHSVPSPASNVAPAGGPFQRFPMPHFSSTAQAPPLRAPPMGQPSIQPSVGQTPSFPASLQPQPQPPFVPMGSPPLSAAPSISGSNVPPPVFQPSFPGHAQRQTGAETQTAPFHFSAPPNQGNFGPVPPAASSPFLPHQGGYIPHPPMVAPLGVQSIQHPKSGPPVGAVQGLIEDFNSLSIQTRPGLMESSVDAKELPRPLDGDVEPKSLAEMYPMNCNQRYLRLTTSALPSSQSLCSRWHLPLGVVVCPLAEPSDGEEVPVVNFAATGVIRCRRCRTYVNPYVTFTEAGRKFRCNTCSLLNDVPSEYYAQLDATGRRVDLNQRPELTKGTVEFVAPAEYMVRPPMPPVYFFLIDVSISAVRSGMIQVVSQTIKSCLDELPGFPRTQIGFATFDSTVHFYNMKSSLTQPQMLVVSDLDDIFVPLPDDLLVNLSESRSVVETFLDSLPSLFQDNMNLESAFGPALKAAFMVMSQLGGKLLIFQNTLPSLGVGHLKLRGDDSRIYGTDKEHALRLPEDPFYKQMAAEFSKYQISVNVYAFSDKYTDIASLGTLAKYSAGQLYYYPAFQSVTHGEKLRCELRRDLTRETAWEAVMRIRCAKGVRFTTYHGNFMLRSTDLLALPAVDCDKAFAMQLSLDETLLTTQTMYFQVALLYTASCGERRIRVHTAAAPVVTDLVEMYRHADTGAMLSLLSRLAIEKTLSHKLEEARSALQLRIVKGLREYRNVYPVQHRLANRMIFPESLKFLPLYGLALCRSTPLRGGYGDVPLDEQCAAGYTIMTLPIKRLLKLLYPSLVRLDEYLLKADDLKSIDRRLPLTGESLDSRGFYIHDDGFRFILWFGRMISPNIANNLLGSDHAVELSKVTLNENDNEVSRRLMKVLEKFRSTDRAYYQLCHLVRQGEQPREGFLLLSNLVEDQMGGNSGYADWMLQISRQVQQ